MNKQPKERYNKDPEFRSLVDMLTSYIKSAKFTPTEMREATILASINYEMYRADRIPFNRELEKQLQEIYKLSNELEYE